MDRTFDDATNEVIVLRNVVSHLGGVRGTMGEYPAEVAIPSIGAGPRSSVTVVLGTASMSSLWPCYGRRVPCRIRLSSAGTVCKSNAVSPSFAYNLCAHVCE